MFLRVRAVREQGKLETARGFYNSSSRFILSALFTGPDGEKKAFAAINIHSSYIPISTQRYSAEQTNKTGNREYTYQTQLVFPL